MSDMYSMQPIGYIKSVFKFKNGTPKQPTVCRHSRGSLTIEKSVFNNPEHSVEDLVNFSHVWILFVFHKNDNVSTKAKVKPPHLNGRKVGLFSCRSPHRPNPVGLTLVKLDRIEGATLFLSGIDMLDGTPVLDIKPYIPAYDSPEVPEIGGSQGSIDGRGDTSQLSTATEHMASGVSHDETKSGDKSDFERIPDKKEDSAQIFTKTSLEIMETNETEGQVLECHTTRESAVKEKQNLEENDDHSNTSCSTGIVDPTRRESFQKNHHIELLQSNYSGTNNGKSECTDSRESITYQSPGFKCDSSKLDNSTIVMPDMSSKDSNEDAMANTDNSDAANTAKSVDGKDNTLIDNSSTASWINNPPVKKLLVRFTPHAQSQLVRFSQSAAENEYKFDFLKNSIEAQAAIEDILRADPRSVYRRQKCEDSLYFFTIDCVHVTCWFDDEFVEVVRIKPISTVEQCNK